MPANHILVTDTIPNRYFVHPKIV
ncbi:hypothetical protein ACT7DA_04610 [Bacillus pacificus]